MCYLCTRIYTNNVKYEKDCNFIGRSFGRIISFRWWFVDNNKSERTLLAFLHTGC